MRYVLTIILTLWISTCFATGQGGELIVYKGDTLTMLCEPLEIYLQKHEPRERIHPALGSGCSTALWRGYVGLWRIDNNRLLLVDIFAYGDKKRSIKNLIFKEQYSEIFVDWFTGDLLIEKGEILKYNHSGYDRYYETEIIANVSEGIIQTEKEYKNGVRSNDTRFSRNPKDIQAEIYKRINWDKLPKLSNDKKLLTELTLDNGKLITSDSIIDKQTIETIYKIEVKRIVAEFPEVQVFYSRGQPLKEGYYGSIIFSRQNKRKYAR